MIKVSRHILFFAGFVLLGSIVLPGCSTERDSFVHRVYHNTNARYNGYFYAKESLREGREKLRDEHKDNYDEVLPIFIYGTEEEAQKIYPQMERVIEKSSRVVDQHTMDVPSRFKKQKDKPEMNKWIDDNYLLIGIGHFYKREYYKSEEFFKFVRKKYEKPEMQVKSNLWLMRTFLKREQENQAREALVKASQVKNFPNSLKDEYNLAFAEYYIYTEEYSQAAKHVETAIPFIEKKKEKARPTFILAQLYQRMGESGKAIDAYEKVIEYKPIYEMEFYARINQAMAFSRRGDNSFQIKQQLNDMLKDDKNLEYRDQIHYALADIFLEERNRPEGIYHLKQSLLKNDANQKQRVKSLLRLADLYFEERQYPNAQAYYDSTQMMISEDHERYKDIANKAESLNELVDHLNLIERNDSLLQLAALPEDELSRRIEEIRQEDVKQKEEELYRQRQEMLAESGLEDGAESNFWAYNPTMKERGMEEFLEYWGDRPLEDNWRRKNKIRDSFAEDEEGDSAEVENPYIAPDADSMVKPLEEYMADVPRTEAEQDTLREEMAEAYYFAGLIYKEKLDDFDNAVEAFEVLTKRFEESSFHVMTYYQLYRAYFNKEKEGYQNPFCSTCNSEYWGNLVLEEYPDSEYAQLVENPEFLEIEELEKAEELQEYKQIFSMFKNRQYIDVVEETTKVIRDQSENHLLPKYYMLKAMAQGELDAMSGIRSNYIASLEDVVLKFPDTEESERAQEILDELSGKTREKAEKADEIAMDKKEMEDGPFECEKDEEQWFALAFERDSENLPAVKAAISNFNRKNFKSLELRVTSNLLGNYAVVLVKQFPSSVEAMNFLGAFNNNDGEVKDLNSAGHKIFVVTKDNYIELFKNKNMDQYVSFFNACYGGDSP